MVAVDSEAIVVVVVVVCGMAVGRVGRAASARLLVPQFFFSPPFGPTIGEPNLKQQLIVLLS